MPTTFKGSDKIYHSVVETAKYIRADLKKYFPGVKFSVRSDSYSGGASVRVKWTDGPTTKQVDGIVKRYEGADFDGMIDLKTYKDFTDEDGQVHHYGANFVFTDRRLSKAHLERVLELFCEEYGFKLTDPDLPSITVSSYGDSAWYDGGNGEFRNTHTGFGRLLQIMAYETEGI